MPGHIRKNKQQVTFWMPRHRAEAFVACAHALGRTVSEQGALAVQLFLLQLRLKALLLPEGRARAVECGADPDAEIAGLKKELGELTAVALAPDHPTLEEALVLLG